MIRPFTAAAVVCTVALGMSQVANAEERESTHPVVQSSTYLDASLPEVPNAVAVSDEGTVIASLADIGAVAIVQAPNEVTVLPLGCPPIDVAISPDGATAWAVCSGNPHIAVIDTPASQILFAGIDVRDPVKIDYLPEVQQLVVVDFEGEIVTVSVKDSYDYSVIQRVNTPDFQPSALAPLSDGSGAYIASAIGELAYLDFTRGSMRILQGRTAGTRVKSLALSKSETRLYGGAIVTSNTGVQSSAIVALNPANGRTIQQVPLTFTPAGFTYIQVAVGHRNLSVSTGLSVVAEGQPTGTFNVALNRQGRMGALTPMIPGSSGTGSGVSRSPSGRYAAVGSTSLRVYATVQEDPAYPPSLAIKAGIKASTLTVTGATTGLRPGTSITVHVRDASKKKASFVAQKVRAVVDRSGNYTWSARTKAKHVKVYVSTPGVKSATLDVRVKR